MSYDPHEHHHRHDPETAVQAAHGARDLANRHKKIILEALWWPATSQEIAERCELDYWQVARRIIDLKRDGKVVDSGVRRPSPAGRSACVWRLI